MHPYLAQKIAAQRGTELRKQAAAARLARQARRARRAADSKGRG